MKINQFVSALLLTTAASSTFALSNQEIINLLNQPSKHNTHQLSIHKPNTNSLNWTSLHGPQQGAAVNIVQMKNNASMLFAFRPYSVGGVYKSIDGGKNWQAIPTPKNVFIFDLISVDENHLLLAADYSIYSSNDQGEHWTLSANLGKSTQKLFSPAPNLILVETDRHSSHQNLYRSLDGGKTWSPARLGLELKYPLDGIAGRDGTLFVSTGQLNISKNGGVLWTQSEALKKHYATSIVISSKHDVFFINRGHTLHQTDMQGSVVNEIKHDFRGDTTESLSIDNQDHLYIVSSDYKTNLSYLYQSTDNGKTWKLLQEGRKIYHVTSLENGKIILSTNEGLMEYDEARGNFIKLPSTFSVSNTSKVFAIDENNLFAVDESVSGPLYGSHDSGKTWTFLREKAIDVNALNKRLLATEWDKNGNETHLLASDDKGKNWQEIIAPSTLCEYLSSQNDALIINCTDGQYLTRNLSQWKKLNSSGSNYVYGNTIYAANRNDIKRSDDSGQTWVTLLDHLNTYGMHTTGYQDKVVLVAIMDAGILKTTDRGNTWDLINNGIEDFYLTGIKAIDENNYIATTHNGVYTTHDSGKHWMADNNGLDNIEVQSLFANKDILLVGTAGSGVFKAALK